MHVCATIQHPGLLSAFEHSKLEVCVTLKFLSATLGNSLTTPTIGGYPRPTLEYSLHHATDLPVTRKSAKTKAMKATRYMAVWMELIEDRKGTRYTGYGSFKALTSRARRSECRQTRKYLSRTKAWRICEWGLCFSIYFDSLKACPNIRKVYSVRRHLGSDDGFTCQVTHPAFSSRSR